MNEVKVNPIGVFHSPQKAPYEAGRQPDSNHSEGILELHPGQNFEQALEGLQPEQRIWIIFSFHHNQHWNPKVLPPRGGNTKVGVFATRSPYRPNSIGMSCVRILKIEGLKIHVADADLLDGSPVLDIKPYVAYADSFPGEEPAWLKTAEAFQVTFDSKADAQLAFLENKGLDQLRSFLIHQLEYEPTNHKKKRVKALADGQFTLAYKTWRALFAVKDDSVHVLEIFSGYSGQDLQNSDDTYGDKALHKEFNLAFSS